MNSEKAFVIYLSVLVYLNCVKYVQLGNKISENISTGIYEL